MNFSNDAGSKKWAWETVVNGGKLLGILEDLGEKPGCFPKRNGFPNGTEPLRTGAPRSRLRYLSRFGRLAMTSTAFLITLCTQNNLLTFFSNFRTRQWIKDKIKIDFPPDLGRSTTYEVVPQFALKGLLKWYESRLQSAMSRFRVPENPR